MKNIMIQQKHNSSMKKIIIHQNTIINEPNNDPANKPFITEQKTKTQIIDQTSNNQWTHQWSIKEPFIRVKNWRTIKTHRINETNNYPAKQTIHPCKKSILYQTKQIIKGKSTWSSKKAIHPCTKRKTMIYEKKKETNKQWKKQWSEKQNHSSMAQTNNRPNNT